MEKMIANESSERVVFLDYLRVAACFMVMVMHACEQYYFGADGGLSIASRRDAFWVTLLDSAVRAAVPLFVIASSYLLFPVTRPTGEFFCRRARRVLLPFALWAVVYTWRFGGEWSQLAFNFPAATGGHLWFVPMLCGLYLLMPLITPWAERSGRREAGLYFGVWLFTTTFPFLRMLSRHCLGEPAFGAVPFLYGECPWNGFGMFHYVSGFFGYLLLGFLFRRFLAEWSWAKTLAVALPLWAAGMVIVWLGFYLRLPGGGFPVQGPYALAVELERSWEFCGTGVALTAVAYFLVLRKCGFTGGFYRWLVLPLSRASYAMYLLHILVLVALAPLIMPHCVNPWAILVLAAATFVVSALAALVLRRLPLIGKWVG